MADLNDLLKNQYQLTKQARSVMLHFINEVAGIDLTTPIEAWEGKDIRHLLVHNADCYLYWLAHMALEETVEWPKEADFNNVPEIVVLYQKVDAAMDRFLNRFEDDFHSLIVNSRTREDKLSASPAMIFTQVITHEFHHKGQIMSMCRQLGYTPPETDVYQFFYQKP